VLKAEVLCSSVRALNVEYYCGNNELKVKTIVFIRAINNLMPGLQCKQLSMRSLVLLACHSECERNANLTHIVKLVFTFKIIDVNNMER